ncbi:Protein BTN1 [Golovinomyces cichoracearum]|uniref:Protein BTN n=1 Tax=Golovinomyces cichoracearum TaxID=62708 RepID=A0A420IT65_9PEZI|nr:Protein BTN1 [Golovinomyces cichoracearum]
MKRFISFRLLSLASFRALSFEGISLFLKDVETRILVAFWIFGLINNVSYVIILSAAVDLVGPSTPKGLVLLVDVFPSFLVKLIAPYFIHKVPYSTRILIMFFLSASGMYIIALAAQKQVYLKLLGVLLASLSSGLGEMSMLGLTHFYGTSSLAAWGSGTGGAGIVGAGLYVLLTSTLELTIRTSLLISATLPFVMPIAFFTILPRGPLFSAERIDYTLLPQASTDDDNIGSCDSSQSVQSDSTACNTTDILHSHSLSDATEPTSIGFKIKFKRAQSNFLPFMLPLLLVYTAEYTINQGIAPNLLFPLSSSPFSNFRSFYPAYAFLYQLGVFISRSSLSFLTISNLLLPSLFQMFNLVLLLLQALYFFLPNVTIVFVIMFWEGLLGGAVYINTFATIMREKQGEEREWSLGATTVSDSAGIMIASLIGIIIEPRICEWNVQSGRPWCRDVGGAA